MTEHFQFFSFIWPNARNASLDKDKAFFPGTGTRGSFHIYCVNNYKFGIVYPFVCGYIRWVRHIIYLIMNYEGPIIMKTGPHRIMDFDGTETFLNGNFREEVWMCFFSVVFQHKVDYHVLERIQ